MSAESTPRTSAGIPIGTAAGSTSEPGATSGPPVRILVVEHEHGTGPERLGTWLEDAGAAITMLRPHLGEAVPDSLSGYDALLVLGGSAGPLEDEANPWLPAVRGLLRRSAAGEFPSFNICLGGELLAAATEAPISRRAHPQIGIYDLHTTEAAGDDPVFAALAGARIPAVLFHQEEMGLPDGAQLLVTGSDAPVQAYRVGEFAWGTQFHPETDSRQIETWLSSDPLRLPEGKTNESVVGELIAADATLIEQGRTLARSFVDYLRGRKD